MATYIPDNWVVLKIKHLGKTYYKVLGGWSGGYTYGSIWRMNSGITAFKETEHAFIFEGFSGSSYCCAKDQNVVRMNIAYALDQLQEKYGNDIEVLPEDTDYSTIIWEET